MPLFIALNLTLSYLVQAEIPYQHFLSDRSLMHIGFASITVSIIGALVRNKAYPLWYDLFAMGTVLIWFSYWHEFYLNDAPMFYLFPVFFAFLMALVSLKFISNRDQFDQESIDHLQNFSKMYGFHPVVIISCVVVSLLLPDHYLLFPIAVSLLIIRYTLTRCLDPK